MMGNGNKIVYARIITSVYNPSFPFFLTKIPTVGGKLCKS